MFNRLAIGTAAWGKEYNGVKVSEDEQKRILDYCENVGIDLIDTATAYGWDWTKAKDFKVVVKVRIDDDRRAVRDMNPYCVMAHSYDFYKNRFLCEYSHPSGYRGKMGVSLYEPQNLNTYMTGLDIIQVPYSLFDRRFESVIKNVKKERISDIEIHVRSVFLRGKLLEKFKPWECIAFCLMNNFVNRVIIGVDSLEQLQEDLAPFHRMNSAEIKDENVLDPRRW